MRNLWFVLLAFFMFATQSQVASASEVLPAVDKFLKDANAGNTEEANAALSGVFTLQGDDRTKPSRYEFLDTIEGCPYSVVFKNAKKFSGTKDEYLEYEVTWDCKGQKYMADIYIERSKTYIELADFAVAETYLDWKNPKERPMLTVRPFEMLSPEEAKAKEQRDLGMANDFANLFIQDPNAAFDRFVSEDSRFMAIKIDLAQDVNIAEIEEYGLDGAQDFNKWVEQNLGKPVSVKCEIKRGPWCHWKFDRPANTLYGPLTFRDGKLEYANLYFMNRDVYLLNKDEFTKGAKPK